ncbi:MAG TPA: hypothetical protein VM802_09405 [Chitinophaga sp.]|uniref:hypothetical protein n=1 Tax=Chitinophaga sp. TaxID=1869181 RepID=UPI002C5DEE8B|nr:hypothetical protein [Chitinophaga sp.]HVI45077.1 hypothetical protein [Chitinophaga sp.]
MEKILYVTDAVKLNRECLEFACYLCNLTHSRLTGVFLENREMELRSKEYIQELAGTPAVPGGRLEDQKELYRDDCIQRFQHICECSGINSTTHIVPGQPLAEVVKESRYADLIVIDASSSFSWQPESTPTAFVREVLKQSECPVVVAPESFDGIREIIFAYNGSNAAMFAIKQFTYLFPQLRHHTVKVLCVTGEGMPLKGDEAKLKEWLNDHYEDVAFNVVEDNNIRAGLLENLFARDKAFVVMGAFGRTALGELFIPNPAETVVKLITQPLFISHS